MNVFVVNFWFWSFFLYVVDVLFEVMVFLYIVVGVFFFC